MRLKIPPFRRRRITLVPALRLTRTASTSLAACALLGLTGSCVGAERSVIETQVAPGVGLVQQIITGNHPLVINCLRVDLKNRAVHVRCGQAKDAITISGPDKGRERLHLLCARDGAVAGINADYFPFTGDPLGLEVRDGELMREPLEYRASLGISERGVRMDVLAHFGMLDAADGTQMSLAGINREPSPGEIVAICPVYSSSPKLPAAACVVTLKDVNLPVGISKPMRGVVDRVDNTPTGAALPVCPPGGTLIVATGAAAGALAAHAAVGDEMRFRFDLTPCGPPPPRGKYAARSNLARGAYSPVWADVDQAVGGGPWLVRNGQVNVDWESEGLNRLTFVEKRHPRTAVGVTGDGVLLLVEVDGRSSLSQGATLDELAGIMKELGAVNAINLDGGGSSSMVARGVVVNAPSDGRERPIADALLVFSEPSPPPPLSGAAPLQLHAGETISLNAGPDAAEDSASPVIWGTADGLGFVSQRGVYTGTVAGTGQVFAWRKDSAISMPVTILPGEPSIIKASMTPIADYPPYYAQLTVTITDRFGNPIPGVQIKAELTGGMLDGGLTTGSNGQASGQIVWDVAPEKRVVRLSSPSVKQQLVVRLTPGARTAVPVDPDDR